MELKRIERGAMIGANVLVVDDDVNFVDETAKFLIENGWGTYNAFTGIQAIRKFRSKITNIDIALVDIVLPDIIGYEVIERIRKISNIPIVGISARNDLGTRINAIKSGADGFITKPIGFFDIMEHLNLQLLNSAKGTKNIVKFGNIIIDILNYEVILPNKIINNLTQHEFDLLVFFATHPMKVITRRELLKNVWSWDSVCLVKMVDNVLRTLQKKIGYGHIDVVDNIGYTINNQE